MLPYRAAELKLDLDLVLSHYRVAHPEVVYLQIGAFDGIQGDPIYPLIERHHLRGILLEPQKDAFARLTANYARFRGFHFVNAAVSAHDGESRMFRIKPEAEGPAWLHQIASFDLNVVKWHAHMVPNLDKMIETETVRCMTFSALFEEIGRETVDLLQIDAEGYDAELLKLFDVPRRKPPIIRFEHKHLKVADHEAALAMLVQNGYRLCASGSDTLAYRGPLPDETFVR